MAINRSLYLLLTLILVAYQSPSLANSLAYKTSKHFYVIALGTSGGEFEDNLSSYLVAPINSPNWIALDAGTFCSALKKFPFRHYPELATSKKALTADYFLDKNLKSFLISHAHLDHISGLVICSPIMPHKPILGINSTINYLRDDIFNWKIWPNLTNEGKPPLGKTFHYQRLALNKQTAITNTQMSVTPYILNHGNGYPSTAFLIGYQDHYLLYVGDTGDDQLQHSHDLHDIWKKIIPLIKSHKLNTIFIEASYTNARKENELFGHLTPHILLSELHELANLVDPNKPQSALKGLTVIVTHIKQGFEKPVSKVIKKELDNNNDLGIRFIIPKQNELIAIS